MSEGDRFLDIGTIYPALAGGGWRRVVRGALGRVLGLPPVWRMMDELETRVAEGQEPFGALLEAAGITVEGDSVESAIPREGGVLVIANHPFGGADALVLGALCTRVRPDTKMLANAELMGVKPVAPHLIPLHILGKERSDRRNVASMRAGLEHLRGGGLLVVFPAGAVSFRQPVSGRVEDPPWPGHTARLVRKSGAPVLPVGFFGRNPGWYQFFGARSPLLRTMLIPRAFFAMRGKVVRCAAGDLLPVKDLPEDVEEMTIAMRRAVHGVLEEDGN